MLTAFKVAEATLRTKDEEPADYSISEDSRRTEVPDDRVPEEIDLTVVFHPEVLQDIL